jgi:transposase
MRPVGNAKELERRRHRAIDLVVREGLTQTEAARRVGVAWRTVARWMRQYRESGKRGLAARPTPGRPARLGTRERNRLERCLLRGAKAAGFETDLWTCPRIATVIERMFGVRYHVDHIGRLLRSLGWSPQRPERRARERDERAIRRWVRTEWPAIKKKSVR